MGFDTQFDFVSFGDFSVGEMFLVGGSFWVFVSGLLVAMFGFINRLTFRNHVCVSLLPQEKSSVSTDLEEVNSEVTEFNFPEVSVSDEENSPKLFSKFEFRRYEEVIGRNVDDGDSDSCSETAQTRNMYQFMSGKAFGVFMEKPEAMSFTVKELYAESKSDEETDSDLQKPSSEPETVVEERDTKLKEEEVSNYVHASDFEFSGFGHVVEESPVKTKEEEVTSFVHDSDFEFSGFGHVVEESPVKPKEEEVTNYVHGSDFEFSGFGHVIDSTSKAFLSGGGFENTKLDDDKYEESEHIRADDHFHNNNNESHDNGGGKCKVEDLEDSPGFESLWEHQDLIEQLDMELKKVRAIGLPTIMEESESPKMMEDLKPWKIDDKFQQQNTMGELHRFYKSYREKMRKFDILNYQKMYAIGFLQSKDPLESISIVKSSIPVIGPLLSEICKRKKSKSEPMVKFMRELHSDLEMVYVGQLCLSWEFLHWQYVKSLELWESDSRGIHRYNEVAGEFQQFQVLMQRFIENESFEGPRVQNYVKNRCVLRNLLQVPVIRDDSWNDKSRPRNEKGNNAITSDMLVEIMEECIRIFWRFLRADKDATSNVMLKTRRENQELQDLADKKLLTTLRADLHKKERKLKEMLRSENCILRRFQKQEEKSTEQVLYFFSQVEVKLVCRVLNMGRVTGDQLLWCHNKLSKISFSNRKISVEPSFLLFPC